MRALERYARMTRQWWVQRADSIQSEPEAALRLTAGASTSLAFTGALITLIDSPPGFGDQAALLTVVALLVGMAPWRWRGFGLLGAVLVSCAYASASPWMTAVSALTALALSVRKQGGLGARIALLAAAGAGGFALDAVFVSGVFTPAAALPFVAASAVGVTVTLQVRNRSLIRDANRIDRAHADSLRQIVWLEERAAVARDLHDVVGHYLTAMILQAEVARTGRTSDGESAASVAVLDEISEIGRHAMGELDQVIRVLRGTQPRDVVSLSLQDIDRVVAAPLRTAGITTKVSVDEALDTEAALTINHRLAIFRLVQEAVTNICKHAQADRVNIGIRGSGRGVEVTVCDNGVGFDPSSISSEKGAGLTTMHERIAHHGGLMSIRAAPAGGTLLEAVIPLMTARSQAT